MRIFPGTNFQDTVALAGRLRSEGMEPVPHVVGRRIANLEALEDFLKRLSGDAGVKQVLVVAGDNATPEGTITSGLQVLESGLLEKYGVRTVGVAGHPEGHREVSEPVLGDALRRKNVYAEKTGSKVYVVTQFTFTADSVINWETAHGTDIGTAACHRRPARSCQREDSSEVCDGLRRWRLLAGILETRCKLDEASHRFAPDDIIVGLAAYRDKTPGSHLAGVHFFPFGGFKKTADWANKVVSGNFEITNDGGLRVD